MIESKQKMEVSKFFMAEVCHNFGQPRLAGNAANLIKDKNTRIHFLINLNLWDEALANIYKYKLEEFYIDEVRRKAPPDIIE